MSACRYTYPASNVRYKHYTYFDQDGTFLDAS
jgi:hypothetical protein